MGVPDFILDHLDPWRTSVEKGNFTESEMNSFNAGSNAGNIRALIEITDEIDTALQKAVRSSRMYFSRQSMLNSMDDLPEKRAALDDLDRLKAALAGVRPNSKARHLGF